MKAGTGTSVADRTEEARASRVRCTDAELTVELTDGRKLSLPLDWYPRLSHGSPQERNNWRLLGDGYGIHWPDLDEDLSVEGLLAGRRSGETERSFQRWLDARNRKRSKT